MKAIIHIADKHVVSIQDDTARVEDFREPIASLLRSGAAKLVPLPANADLYYLKVEGDVVVEDTAKKTADEAKKVEKAARKARLKSHDVAAANSIAQLRPIVADLLAELRED